MSTATKPKPPRGRRVDERGVIRGASWDLYDRLSDAIETPGIRMAYDGKDIEVMTLGPRHESVSRLLGQLIDLLVDALAVDCLALGSTTWKRVAVDRGIESDNCYVFDAAKLKACRAALRRNSNDVADYPDPDLAIEVDISEPLIDRPDIYAKFKVLEVWRVNKKGVVSIEHLFPDGKYISGKLSIFLLARPSEVTRWLKKGASLDRVAWRRAVVAEIETTVKPRVRG
jgi:Uma2 family endonuclease